MLGSSKSRFPVAIWILFHSGYRRLLQKLHLLKLGHGSSSAPRSECKGLRYICSGDAFCFLCPGKGKVIVGGKPNGLETLENANDNFLTVNTL